MINIMDTTRGYWIRFYGNKATVVWDSVEKVGKAFHVEQDMSLARKRAYSGYLSKSAQSVIHKRLFAWMESVRVGNHFYGKFKAKEQTRLVFITLTLSATQRHTDKWIKKNMLELFLKRMQNKYNVVNYFWKAETQKNGNLHFHLILDKFIGMTFIQSNWNEIQRSAGYLDYYFSMHGHYNAPSTHIRELSKMMDGIGYAMKYCSKNETCRPIDGAIFRFSNSLLNVTIPPVLILPEYEEEWRQFCVKYVKKVVKDDFWTSLFFNTRARGFKQPAFVAKETFTYYLGCYDALYNSLDCTLSILQLNDNCFKVTSTDITHAQSFGDTSKAEIHAHRKAELQTGAPTSPAPSVSQLSLFEESLRVPWFYDV